MKLIFAVVNHDDARAVITRLLREGFMATKISTFGGFLKRANVTIMVGVDDERVASVIHIIRNETHIRTQLITLEPEHGFRLHSESQLEVTVGGATIFILDVERFEKK